MKLFYAFCALFLGVSGMSFSVDQQEDGKQWQCPCKNKKPAEQK